MELALLLPFYMLKYRKRVKAARSAAENSGNTLRLIRLRAGCDQDAILAIAEPAGPVCYTGGHSCFDTSRRYTWEYLQGVILDRRHKE